MGKRKRKKEGTPIRLAERIILDAWIQAGAPASAGTLAEKVKFLSHKLGIPCPQAKWWRDNMISFAISVILEIQKKNSRWNIRRLEKLTGKKITPIFVPLPTATVIRIPSQKQIDAFYDSWEWKRCRYDFLKSQHRRCQCCGRTPEEGASINVDHIKPIRRYWDLRLSMNNLQILCSDCNMGKGSRDQTDWRV
jgi:hypothetical protein